MDDGGSLILPMECEDDNVPLNAPPPPPAKDKDEQEASSSDEEPDGLAEYFQQIQSAAGERVPFLCVSSDGMFLASASSANRASPLFCSLVLHYFFSTILRDLSPAGTLQHKRFKQWLYLGKQLETYEYPVKRADNNLPFAPEPDEVLVNETIVRMCDALPLQSFFVVYQDYENMLRSWHRGNESAFVLLDAACRHFCDPAATKIESLLGPGEALTLYNVVKAEMDAETKEPLQ